MPSEYENSMDTSGAAASRNALMKSITHTPYFTASMYVSRNLSILRAPYAAAHMGTIENPKDMAGIMMISRALHPEEYTAMPSTGSTVRIMAFITMDTRDMKMYSMDAGIPTFMMSLSSSGSKRNPLRGMPTKVSFLTRYQYSAMSMLTVMDTEVAHAAPAIPQSRM